MIEADLDDATSVRKAFDGAYGAYVVTNFWAQRTPEQEQVRTAPRWNSTRPPPPAPPRTQLGHGVVHPRSMRPPSPQAKNRWPQASADAEAASSSWITVQTAISTLIEIEGYDWPHEEATVQAGRAAGQCE